MPWKLANPDRLFDRTWRPRHPLRPRLSTARRWCMLSLLVILSFIILGYGWLTDSRRVRAMAGAYLSDLLGADVQIRRASLSIFEGLRLDDVTVRVEGGYRPDATVFYAQTVLIHYNPAELLVGKLAATEIIAITPTVVLVEETATHRWNYQRLWHGAGVPPRHTGPSSTTPAVLPTIILRDAEVRYLQLANKRTQTVGWYSLEGRLSPGAESDQYDLELQSRGRESLGPSVDGTIRTGGGPSVFRMRNFTFGPDIVTMLLAEPRAWCERHQLQGRIDVPEMLFTPGKDGGDPTFRVEIALSSVELAISPQEWMSRQQNLNVEFFHGWLDSLAKTRWFPTGLAPALRRLSSPEPIHMRQVSGTLVFTEKGIELKSVNGRLENNWFNVDGKIAGYSPDAAATLTASSLSGHDLEIPPWSPTYAGSLPPEVQEIYERLHPQGSCSVSVTLDRKDTGARPNVTGQIDIHDGQFRFSDFPYLLSGATGVILIGHDPIAKMDGIRIVNVHGHGMAGGPNANSVVSLDGFIGPMDQVAGVWLDVRGKNLSSEPAIRAALPPTVDRALRLFDPAGNGDLPKFRGDILCHIYRPIGQHKRWIIETDLTLDDADGTLVFFPYPLKGLSGRLEIYDNFLNIVGANARHGDGTIAIDGTVNWKTNSTRASTQPTGPDLHIVARNLPVDDDLKNAIPAQERDWLKSAGAGGTLDVEGHVFPKQIVSLKDRNIPGADVDYIFDARLHEGKLWPVNAEYALSEIGAKLHITPTQFLLTDATARRGSGIINGHMTVTMGEDQEKMQLSGTAQQMPMDSTLYSLLPQPAREAWDEIKPEGDVDATLQYETTMIPNSAGLPPADKLDLQIRPRDLAITPGVFPYRLEKVKGLLNVSPQKVTLGTITAQHGSALVTVSGQADLGDHPVWNLKLAAKDLLLDSDFLHASPDIVSQVIDSLKLNGKVDVEFSNLAYRPVPKHPAPDSPASVPHGVDMEFAANITLNSAPMDLALPATDIDGTIDLAGLVRDGKIHRIAAQLAADKMKLAGASATNFTAELSKPSDDNVIQISRLQGQFAGGDLSGNGQFSYSDAGPGRYDFSVVLHDADVQQLAAHSDKKFQGRLSASLEMGGSLDDVTSRRGHGDVHVFGDNMYNLPVMMGLLQITNLALPLSSPFSEADTRYTIDGQQVSFDSIDLKSKDMTMSGDGRLDFAAKTVSLWFVTDNPTLVNLPLVGPLIHGAKQELLRIHVSGTIQQPKVSASTFNTVTTTVDQVLRNGDQK